MFYPENIVEEIRMRNDIVDVISGYVKLQKKGGNHFGLCPFHNEKSPSFSVSGPKQMYYCFGCGAGGNVITFLMEYENYSFGEALEILAARAGVELPKKEFSKEDRMKADLKAVLLELNKLSAKYFHYHLYSEQGQAALNYLKNRSLTEDTIRHFGLGVSLKYSDALYKYLKNKGYSDEVLKKSGLVSIEERGAYDKFWNRVMFPIMDVNNRVIGFGGRVLGDGNPKYLNSPETLLFDKSRNLYGLNFARISREKYMLICEGYMDVIALHQAGFTNSVASLGTAFTTQQANLLKRYTDQVILTYDSDPAGTKAALRAIPILKDAGISVKVLDMSPYKDPDDFMKAEGREGYQTRIDRAVNSFLFEIRIAKENYAMEDPEQKTAFYNEAAKKLLEFTEVLERNNYIEAVAKDQNIPYEDLRKLVNQLGAQYAGQVPKARPKTGQEIKKEKDDGMKQSQKLLLTWLIEDESLFEKIDTIISADDFIEPLFHEVARMVFCQHEAGQVNPAQILNHFINDNAQYKEVAGLFNARLQDSLTNEEMKKAFAETVIRVRKNSLDYAGRSAKSIEELQEIIQKQAQLSRLHISID